MSDAPSHSIRIAPSGIEHLTEIAALAGLVWRAHYPGIISHAQIDYMLARMYHLETMARELRDGVAYERLLIQDQLRGFSSYGPVPNTRELKLHKLYIHPDTQRQGLAHMLLQRVEMAAREQRLDQIVLAVNKQNAPAIAAYRKHGFTIRDSVVVKIGDGFVMDDYVMVKPIAPATR